MDRNNYVCEKFFLVPDLDVIFDITNGVPVCDGNGNDILLAVNEMN